ncbi:MAG: hypothetical protein JWP00_2650 [Chloroflexi bacterium]|nr:hypothetical protein [Chloroflexota bacterium]
MNPIALGIDQLRANLSGVLGKVSATNVPDFARGSGYLFRKGDVFDQAAHAEIIGKLTSLVENAPAGYKLHLIELTEGEVSEDEAGLRLARLVAGPGLELRGPVESRVNLVATRRGLLRIDLRRLNRLNELPGIAVFTLYDAMAVNAGTEVAGAKVTPLVYPLNLLEQVGKIAQGQPVIDVLPFQPYKVGVVVREQLAPKPRARFMEAVEKKLAWFGSELLGVAVSENNAGSLADRLSEFKAQGADLILHVGGHASDPLDPVFPALDQLDIRMERLGAPAHPGTLFWLAYWDKTALFGLASCGMFSRTTLGDLFLARLLAGEHLTSDTIARMGYGGLFTREMAFRFPPYGLKDTLD